MSIYTTSDEQKVRVYEIAESMKTHKLSDIFISDIVDMALYYEGTYDLMELWESEKDGEEKNQIIATLRKEIEEYKKDPKTPTLLPK